MTTAAAPAISFGEDRHALDPQRGFRTHGEFLSAVMAAGAGAIDERLVPLRASIGSDEQAGYSDPHGGFLMPTAWAPRALTADADDPAAGRTLPVTMTAPLVHVAARVNEDRNTSVSGGLRMLRRPDATEVTPARLTMNDLVLTAYELFGVTFATGRLVSDSPVTFIELLERSYRDETNAVMLEERLRGAGVGECLGVLKSGALITIDKETGQAADTILAENVVKMRARCWGYGRAVWIVNPELFPQVMKATIPIGTGGSPLPIWQAADESNSVPDRILGRPAYFADAASAIGDVGDIVCSNWSQYLDATYIPLRGESSMHVRFLAGEQCFRFYTRNDGQPWWRVPVLPKRSTVTMSPFVTLAARA